MRYPRDDDQANADQKQREDHGGFAAPEEQRHADRVTGHLDCARDAIHQEHVTLEERRDIQRDPIVDERVDEPNASNQH